MKEISNLNIEEFRKFISKQLSVINNFELMILKGHILTEYTINLYIDSISNKSNPDFCDGNTSYSLKLKIIENFGKSIGNVNTNFFEELNMLNKLRNDIAHKLKYNDQLIKNIYSLLSKKDSSFSENNFKDDISKFGCALAFIIGYIHEAYFHNTHPEESGN